MNSKIKKRSYLRERRKEESTRKRMKVRTCERKKERKKNARVNLVETRESPYLYRYPATYRWRDYAATMLQFSL